jgi:hypothetical protein
MCLVWQSPSARAQEVELVTGNSAAAGEGGGGLVFLGLLPINFSVSISEGYDDNPNLESGGISGAPAASPFTTGMVYVSYGLSKERTTLSLRVGGEFTHYSNPSAELSDSTTAYANLYLIHSLSERFQVTGSVDTAYSSEPDFRSDVGVENRRAYFWNTTGAASATYNLTERTSLTTNASYQRIKYDDFSIGFFEDHSTETFGGSIRYNLLPEAVLLADYQFEMDDYDTFPRDSTNHTISAGIDEQLTPQLKVGGRGGITLSSFTGTGQQIDPYAEVTVSYLGAHSSNISWVTSYGVEQPNSAMAQSRLTLRTGLNLGYSLWDSISTTVAIYYHHDENQGFATDRGPVIAGPGFSEDAIDISLNAHYAFRQRFSVDLTWQYSEVMSGEVGGSYSRNRFSAGLSYTY